MTSYVVSLVLHTLLALNAVHAQLACSWKSGSAGESALKHKQSCEPLQNAQGLDINVGMSSSPDAQHVTYVDTQVVVYDVPPPNVHARRSRIRVAAITTGITGCDWFVPGSCNAVFDKVEAAGRHGADVALLPEEFATDVPLDGCNMTFGMQCNLTEFVGSLAKKHNMYIIFGMRAMVPVGDIYPVDPSRPTKSPDGKLGYNTAVIVSRQGEVVGHYRKAWPCCPAPDGSSMNDGYPSRDMAKVFDLDFGRVGLQTCYDMNFAETWHALYAQHVDIVFWPSAYGGGMPVRAYAKLYHYYIVPVGFGDMTDITGQIVPGLKQLVTDVFLADIDLDRTFVHDDFNSDKVARLLAENNGLVEQQFVPEWCATEGHCSNTADLVRESGFYLLARTDEGYSKNVSVRSLLGLYGIEPLRDYQHRSRKALNEQRQSAHANPNIKRKYPPVASPITSNCVYDSAEDIGHFQSNFTCEPLAIEQPNSSLTTSLLATEKGGLDAVFYVDARTIEFAEPPTLPSPKKSRIKVAALTIGCCSGDYSSRLDQALAMLHQAGERGVDVALLPEEFAGPAVARPGCDSSLDWKGCNETDVLRAVAKKHSMYVIFGMRALAPEGDPYPPDPTRKSPDGKLGYNTDVIIDRQGAIVGYYRKSWPCCPGPDGSSMDDGYPSRELVKVFDLDFGRVGLQTCFDMNFMDTWHELYAKRADIVFWPSAYGGGLPIRGYAALYHYYIVPAGWGDITGPDGLVVPGLQQELPNMFTAHIDLDRTYFHVNFNSFNKLLTDYKGLIAQEVLNEYCSAPGNCQQQTDLLGESGFVSLVRTDAGYDKGVSVRALMRQYNLTDLSTYQHMSRRALNMQRLFAAASTARWPYLRNGSASVDAHPQNSQHEDMRAASYSQPVQGATVTTRRVADASGAVITNSPPKGSMDPLFPMGTMAGMSSFKREPLAPLTPLRWI